MQNFIFISPNFPTNYWQFCRELKNNGMNVLGIGDQPYDELKPELKDSLNDQGAQAEGAECGVVLLPTVEEEP